MEGGWMTDLERGEQQPNPPNFVLCYRWTRVIITMAARCLRQLEKTIQLWPCKNVDSVSAFTANLSNCRFKLLYLVQTHTKAVPCVALLSQMVFWHVDKEEQKHSWRIKMLRGAELPCWSEILLSEAEEESHKSSFKVAKLVLCF